ncbi:MAG: signal transduction histidine kinase [Verrucomicrobiales bacterium]|jgi:signal transduction histidine kinase
MDNSTPAESKPLRILCLEDNDPDFELVEEYLSMATSAPRYELSRAIRVDDACQQLLAAQNGDAFDVILADLSLPDSKGEATFLALQEVAPGAAIAVLTGLDDDELGLRLVKEGAQDFLPKDQLGPTFLMRSILHSVERKRISVEMEKLHDDLKSAQLQLIQADKLESLGRLSAGVAHEIKNPLGMLQGCVDFYKMRASDESDEAETIIRETMQDAIQRATKIVSGMLDFSRDEKLELKLANLNTLTHYAIDLVAPDLRSRGIEVMRELDNELPLVSLDPTKIEQVIVNLLINAMHASDEGGKIKIRTYAGELGDLMRNEGLRTLEHLRSGDEVTVVEVRDYGSGIPEDKFAKIFDPFFTTKATGKGTGLGLSVSKTIMDLHSGLLRIQNVDPTGVRAQIILRGETALHTAAGPPSPSTQIPKS